jgi:hypothetical protein
VFNDLELLTLGTYIYIYIIKLYTYGILKATCGPRINSPVLPAVTDKHQSGYLIVRLRTQIAITPRRNGNIVLFYMKMLIMKLRAYFRVVEMITNQQTN